MTFCSIWIRWLLTPTILIAAFILLAAAIVNKRWRGTLATKIPAWLKKCWAWATASRQKGKRVKLERLGMIGLVILTFAVLPAVEIFHLGTGASSSAATIIASIIAATIFLAVLIVIIATGGKRGGGTSDGPSGGKDGQQIKSETKREVKTGSKASSGRSENPSTMKSGWRTAGGILLSILLVVVIALLAAHYSPWLVTPGPGLTLLIVALLLLVAAVMNKGWRKFAIFVAVLAALFVVLEGGWDNTVKAFQESKLTPAQRIRLQYSDWGKDWCSEDETQDYENTRIKEITIHLEPGCFHGPVTVPFHWQNFKVRQTCSAGDWYDIWADGVSETYAPQPCYRSLNFPYFPGRGPTWMFRYQGKGTITLYATTWR